MDSRGLEPLTFSMSTKRSNQTELRVHNNINLDDYTKNIEGKAKNIQVIITISDFSLQIEKTEASNYSF